MIMYLMMSRSLNTMREERPDRYFETVCVAWYLEKMNCFKDSVELMSWELVRVDDQNKRRNTIVKRVIY